MSRRSGLPLRWAVLLVFGVCSMMLFGQDNPQPSQTDLNRTVTTPLQVNVIGCLKKTASGSYSVTDEQGRTWQLTSKKTDLANYVSHKVSVSGHPSIEARTQGEKSGPNQSTEASGNQSFALDVLELRIVSPSCSR